MQAPENVGTDKFEPTPGGGIIKDGDDNNTEVVKSPDEAKPEVMPISSSYDNVIKSINGQELYSDVIKKFKDAGVDIAVGYANQSLNSNKVPVFVASRDSIGFLILMNQFMVVPFNEPLQDIISSIALTELKRSYKISQEPSMISSYMRIKVAASLKFWEQKADPGFEGSDD